MSKTHEHWASRIGFLMATAGSAIGLGSLWKFPYMTGTNGGGAFLLLYVIFTFSIGLPVFIADLAIGRKAQRSSILAFTELSGGSQNWRILGWLNVLTSLLILTVYCVVAGWSLSYTLMSLNQFTTGKSAAEISATFDTLFRAPGINIFWFTIYLLANLGIVIGGVRKGIEYWSKVLMPALFIILIGLFIYATTLPGFGQAVEFLFIPRWDKLSSNGILNALGMAFFTLSVGFGIIITYGSYMQKEVDIPKNGALIAFMTVLASIIAALTIFPVVFSFGLPAEEGPGLLFKTLPVLFAKLPASLLISTIFFSLVFFAAITSSISLLEVLVANIMEVFAITRKQAVYSMSLITFVVGIPSALSGSKLIFPSWQAVYGKSFLDTIDYLVSSWMAPFACLFVTLFVGWNYSKQLILAEFRSGTTSGWLALPWYYSIKYLASISVIIIILQQAGLLALLIK